MLEIVFDAFVYVLALYGLITLIKGLLWKNEGKVKSVRTSYKLILTVKNQEDSIEGIIRSIFRDEMFRAKDTNASVVVIDKGSTDETVKILKKLQDIYENLEVIQDQDS